MFLRFLLVSAVTCLGVDLPAWRQAATDVRAGCSWCRQQLVAAAEAVIPAAPAPDVKVAEAAAPESPMPVGTDAFVADAAPMPVGSDAFARLSEPTPDLTAALAVPEPTPAPAPEPASEPAPIVAVAADPDAGFQVVMTETVSRFAADLAGGATAPSDTALASIPEPPPLPEPAPAPEAEAPAEELYPGLAFALNRDADGLADELAELPPPALVQAPTAPAPEPTPERGARLAAAIRLTSQAAHAWLSVLHAPSVALDEAAALSR
jgi:hypothetical protein